MSPIARGILAAVLVVVGVFVAGPTSSTSADAAGSPPLAAAQRRPNVVVIMADDLDLGLMRFLPQARRLVSQQGARFTQYYVNTSLCCVARASVLRGQYAHNTGVEDNLPPAGGFLRYHQLGRDQDDLAVWMREAGYTTSLVGKYLNGYPYVSTPGPYQGQGVGRLDIPPGWDDWFSAVGGDPYGQYDYSVNDNGTEIGLGSAPEDYLTDVLRDRASRFIAGQSSVADPFFLFVTPYSPHAPYTPPARYQFLKSRTSLRVPRTPDFDESSVGDKPAPLSGLRPLTRQQRRQLDGIYRRRAGATRAVDDLVAGVVDTLTTTGQLDNTYVFVTSDNGYHLGQHRLPPGKYTPYETDIRQPLLVRGPGIDPGTTIDELVGNIDLAPSLLALAGASAPAWLDGGSFVPWLVGRPPGQPLRSSFLLERRISTFVGTPRVRGEQTIDEPRDPRLTDPRTGRQSLYTATPFQALRSRDGFTYVRYADGQEELYDSNSDPYQLVNLMARRTTAARPGRPRGRVARRPRAPADLRRGRLPRRRRADSLTAPTP